MRISRRGVIAQRKSALYTWSVYLIDTVISEQSTVFPIPDGMPVFFASGYTKSNGLMSLQNPSMTYITTGSTSAIVRYYVSPTPEPSNSLAYCNDYMFQQDSAHLYSASILTSAASKGASAGFTVESTNISDYPTNGIKGNYWYVLD